MNPFLGVGVPEWPGFLDLLRPHFSFMSLTCDLTSWHIFALLGPLVREQIYRTEVEVLVTHFALC